ncbi:MAG: NAD(P)H-dependent oxidoreductase [Geodermatophilaceae bacterium]|nr:NAD(P)H-dependent oxidoreductase [Geodermatophilaceae bacterium]
MKLHIIIASTRPGRAGKTVADWFSDQVPDDIGFDVEVVDLAEVGLPLLDEPNHPAEHVYVHEHTRRWSASVAAADAFVLVMPEYNVGFIAPLKNALDYLYTEWNHKPVGFVSYGMTSAGLRAVEMIKPVLVSLQMVPIHSAVSIPLRSRLDAEGVLHPDEIMAEAAQQLLSELRLMADTLAPLRASDGEADALERAAVDADVIEAEFATAAR